MPAIRLSLGLPPSLCWKPGSNVALLPSVPPARQTTYALRLAAGRWTTYALAGALSIDAAAVFSPSDVWAFGEAVQTRPVLGYGPPYAARFDGHRWRRVPIPGVPLTVNVLSGADIWAFGPTARAAGNFNQTYIAMHWAGHGWTTRTLPRMPASGGKLAFPSGLAVLHGDSLWMTEQFHCPSRPACRRSRPESCWPTGTAGHGYGFWKAAGTKCIARA
jgi:hypothetical protein